MQNKTIRRFLAAAMTAVVAVTSMPLQNVVYAAETTQSETSEAIADVQTAEDADSTGDGNEQPAIGDVVKKHTINVIPDDPESENTEGKDTYWKLKWSDEFDGTTYSSGKLYTLGNRSSDPCNSNRIKSDRGRAYHASAGSRSSCRRRKWRSDSSWDRYNNDHCEVQRQ